MNLRGTLGLLLIAAGLGLYIWMVEIRGEEQRQATEIAENRVLELDARTLQRFELPTGDEGSAMLVRDGDTWRLKQPVDFAANPATVDAAIDTLTSLESTARIEADASTLFRYGLDENARRVRLWTSGDTPQVLRLGAAAPVGGVRYLMIEGQPQVVYTALDAKLDSLTPDLGILRDKRVVRIEGDEVGALRIVADGTLVAALERPKRDGEAQAADAGWQVTAPIQDRADATVVSRLITDLNLSHASAFIDEPRGDEAYGLNAPAIEIELVGETERHEIAIARADGLTYLRVKGNPVVFQVAERMLDNVSRDPFSYRDKSVLDLAEDDVKGIEIEFPRKAKSYKFERRNNEWQPEEGDLKMRPLKIDDLLFAIESLEATGLVEDAKDADALGLAPARVRVRATDSRGAELGWLELGDPAPELGLPARSSGSERVWRVANDLGRDVPLGLEAFDNLFLAPAEDEAPDDAAAAEESR